MRGEGVCVKGVYEPSEMGSEGISLWDLDNEADAKDCFINDDVAVDVMRSPTKSQTPKGPSAPHKKPKASPNKAKTNKSSPKVARRPKKQQQQQSPPRRRSSGSPVKPKTTAKTLDEIVQKLELPSKGTKRPRSKTPVKSPKQPRHSTPNVPKKLKVEYEEGVKARKGRERGADNVARTIESVIAKYTCDPFAFDDKAHLETPFKSKKETPIKDELPKKRGRPKGSKNKVRPQGPKKASPKALKHYKGSETDSSLDKSPKKLKQNTKPPKKGMKAKPAKKVISSKAAKLKAKAPVKPGKASQRLTKASNLKSKKAPTKGKAPKSSGDESASSGKSKKGASPQKTDDESEDLRGYFNVKKNLLNKYKASTTDSHEPRRSTKTPKSKASKREDDSAHSSDDEPREVLKYPKKAFRDKWKKELKQKKISTAPESPSRARRQQKSRSVTFGLNNFNFLSDSESAAESENEPEPHKSKKQTKKAPSIKRPNVEAPRRTARMASLNAMAMMHCMHEDAKVSFSATSSSPKDSLAVVPRRYGTVAVRHSDNSDTDSDSEPTKRKSKAAEKSKATRRRRRHNELGVQMDMRDMVVTKRMASLNASAIMAASYSMESRSRRMPNSTSSENEVTDVDIKSKISYQALKDAKSRSVITVQETTKKVKKAQGSRETEVEQRIIVKKKVKRQSEVKPAVQSDKEEDNATDTSDAEMLPKTPDSGMMIESTITYVTTQTLTVPKTAAADGKTTTLVQHVQRKAVTTTSASSSTSSATVAPGPPQAITNTSHESQGAMQKYSPLNALSDMHPVNHPNLPHAHPYPHHQHLMAPPHPSQYPHHQAILPPHMPYPPQSPHSPPYPPPSSSTVTSSPSACPSPSAVPKPAPPGPRAAPYQPPSTMSPSPWDDRMPMVAPLARPGCERHHSAFTAPTPSAHSPASGHSYQPVSGPMPLGSPTSSSYKPPATVSTAPASYAPPPSLMSSPTHKSYPPTHPYGPHNYASYDKYLRHPPYQLYPSQYAPPVGQYPPPHPDYNYHQPPHPPMHYSQEYSYTLCVPPAPQQPSQQALALPPPPSAPGSTTAAPPPSAAPHPPYYHCPEMPPVFAYPPSGPPVATPPNAVCCRPSSKNVPCGPLIGAGKGPPRDIKDKWHSQHPYYVPPPYQGPPPNVFPRDPLSDPVKPKEKTPSSTPTASPQKVPLEIKDSTPPSSSHTHTTVSPPTKDGSHTTKPWVAQPSASAPSDSSLKASTPPKSSANTTTEEPKAKSQSSLVRAQKAVKAKDSEMGTKEPSTKKKESKVAATNANKSSGPRHLLCQPQPLSHVKTSSVLPKAKPVATAKTPKSDLESEEVTSQPITNGGSKNSSARSSGAACTSAATPQSAKEDRDAQPRRRGRPPKPQHPPTLQNNNNNEEFFRDASDVVRGEEDRPVRRRMSLLASVDRTSADSTEDLVVDLSSPAAPATEVLPREGLLSVKTEAYDQIKQEKLSPKLAGVKNAHTNPLKDIKGEQQTPKTLMESVKNDVEGSLSALKTETSSGEDATKQPCAHLMALAPPLKMGRVGRPPKSPSPEKNRRNASSLLSFLNYKNPDTESVEAPEPVDSAKKAKKSKVVAFPPPNPTQFCRKRRVSDSAKTKACKKPKYLHGWSWDGEPCEANVWLRNDEQMMTRNCYKSIRHKQGDCIKVRDCVLLRSGTRKTDLPYVAKVASLWEDPETSDMMMSILWYYRPEHTEFGRRPEDLSDEIFASKHRDHLSVACIEDRCYVLTFNEYCRYRRQLRLLQESVEPTSSPVPEGQADYGRRCRQPNKCVVQDLLFFCRKIYDYRQKRILKNPWENGPLP